MSFLDWLSDKNNPKLPKSEYMFGTRHIILLVSCFLAILILSFILRNKSEKTKTIFFKVCGWIFLSVEILQRILKFIFAEEITFSWAMQKILPLYFCSITVVLLSIALIINNKTMINSLTIMAILVTTAFLVAPATGLNKQNLTFDALYSISSHGFGFVVGWLLIITRQAKFEFKNIWKTFLFFAGAVVYGLIMSLVVFPNTEDYVFILNNPLEFECFIPYPIIYVVFLSCFITIFYLVEYLCKKIYHKKHG